MTQNDPCHPKLGILANEPIITNETVEIHVYSTNNKWRFLLFNFKDLLYKYNLAAFGIIWQHQQQIKGGFAIVRPAQNGKPDVLF